MGSADRRGRLVGPGRFLPGASLPLLSRPSSNRPRPQSLVDSYCANRAGICFVCLVVLGRKIVFLTSRRSCSWFDFVALCASDFFRWAYSKNRPGSVLDHFAFVPPRQDSAEISLELLGGDRGRAGPLRPYPRECPHMGSRRALLHLAPF